QNIEALISIDPNSAALHKYAKAASLLSPTHTSENPAQSSRYLITLLTQWTELMNFPKLSAYGVTHNDIDLIVRATGQKNNPIQLSAKKLSQILQARL
ncbi:MAG: iron-containing alcohol dehydrogenase, partial [Desulfobacteraceae bacterium]|nr:iron-containing alcohol dehydrogenase [Desulfobacteraceae bacterium]